MADYIKRSDAMTICERYSEHCFETSDSRGQDIADRILDDIAEMHTADVVEVKRGEWVHSSRGFDVSGDYECSICKSQSGIKHFYNRNKYSFCPDCGAKMDGGKTE